MPCGTRPLGSTPFLQQGRWRRQKTTFCPQLRSSTCHRATSRSKSFSSRKIIIWTNCLCRGDIVSYQNYVLSRMPEVWGEDAGEFNPYRWFTKDGESVSYSPFSKNQPWILMSCSCRVMIFTEYHSWNAGPRSCPGRALATYEGIAISTAIIQRFDVILSNDSKDYEPLAALNMVWSLNLSSFALFLC